MLQVLKYDISLVVQKRHGLCRREKKNYGHEGPSMKKREKNVSASRLMHRKNDEEKGKIVMSQKD
jgi:hypothetical protein